MSIKARNFKWGYIALFATLLGIGICLITLKETLMALSITIGCTVAIFGLVWGTLGVAKDKRGFGFVLRIIFASMCVVAGVIAAIFNADAIEIIISILSLLLIMDASFKIRTTAMAKRYSLPLWWIILSLAALTIIGGFILLKHTPEKIEIASILLGIVFIVDSVSNLLSAFYVAAYEKREKAEHYREFYEREIAPRAKAALECEREATNYTDMTEDEPTEEFSECKNEAKKDNKKKETE